MLLNCRRLNPHNTRYFRYTAAYLFQYHITSVEKPVIHQYYGNYSVILESRAVINSMFQNSCQKVMIDDNAL